jgi:two-component system nitrate/nitrite response regulator NarL
MKNNPTAVILIRLPLLLGALASVAERAGLLVIGVACDTEEALEIVERLRPDVFLVDIDLEDGANDLEVLRAVRDLLPEVRIVALSSAKGHASIESALGSGATVYALRDAEPDDLAVAIRQLFKQSVFVAADWRLAASSTGTVAEPLVRLTPREREILRLVAEGQSNRAVASLLSVTEPTIKFHLSNIYRKVEVSNRTEASSWALAHGLLAEEHVEDVVARPAA